MKNICLLFCVVILSLSCVSTLRLNLDACIAFSFGPNIIGSGVVVECTKEEVGYEITVLTAKHVIKHSDTLFIDKENIIIISKVEHPDHDVALIKCIVKSYIAPVRCQFSDPRPLEICYTVGYPLGLCQVITQGLINHPVANVLKAAWMCTSAVMPGNSGGGVFNKNSELLGITVMMIQVSSNDTDIHVPHLHLFIPISKIKDWLKEHHVR